MAFGDRPRLIPPPRPRAVRVTRSANDGPLGRSGLAVSLYPIVPQDGGQLIPSGGSYDFKVEGEMQISSLLVDVPINVSCVLTVDGVAVLRSEDLLGVVGEIRVGDFSGEAYLPAREVRVLGTNYDASARDVRAWVVVQA